MMHARRGEHAAKENVHGRIPACRRERTLDAPDKGRGITRTRDKHEKGFRCEGSRLGLCQG
jgi:hypothetical protein